MKSKRLKGFTFVELIFAITVMGVLFGLATTVVIGMIRFYTFANTVRTNQQEARSIMNSIANDAADGQVAIQQDDTGNPTLCIKTSRDAITYSLDKSSGILTRKTYNAQPQDNCQQARDRTIKGETKMNNDKFLIYGLDLSLLGQGAGGGNVVLINNNVTSLILGANFVTGSSIEDISNFTQNSDQTSVCAPGNIYCNSLELNTAVKTTRWK